MLFGNKKVSSNDVLSYYTSAAVLEHYSQATEKVGLWNSERIVFKKAFKNKSLKLLELGCGAGRISFGLSTMGYTNLTATDFSPKMVKCAQTMGRRNKKSIKFELQDAISLSYEDQSFDGVIFGFNGLMQIPGSDNRNTVIRESLRVLKPAGKFVFTSHDRNLPKWKKFWKIERQKWQKGQQDPLLQEFGDRFEETDKGKLYLHVPEVTELRLQLQKVGFIVEGDFLRSKIAEENEITRNYSDECRFWICRKPS